MRGMSGAGGRITNIKKPLARERGGAFFEKIGFLVCDNLPAG